MIALSGVIGAGKTSLASKLGKVFHSRVFYEPVKNNPILPLFYRGNKLVSEGKANSNPYTFILQIYFLNLRFRMIKNASREKRSILDRSIYEDKIFMKMNYDMGNTSKAEWDVYKSLLANMMEELPYEPHKKSPDLMVCIHVSLKTELKHIKLRGRAYEQVDTSPSLKSYYRNLQKYYQSWYKSYNYSPKMMIDGDKYDFVHNPNDFRIVTNEIEDKLNAIRHE